jgi:hypothetical protein
VCTTNPITAVAGVATFAGCKINGSTGAGTYTLSAGPKRALFGHLVERGDHLRHVSSPQGKYQLEIE